MLQQKSIQLQGSAGERDATVNSEVKELHKKGNVVIKIQQWGNNGAILIYNTPLTKKP